MYAAVGFAGDVMSHVGLVILEREGQPFSEHFSPPVRTVCRLHDELWGNLEGPVSSDDDGLATHRRFLEEVCERPKLFFPRQYLPVLSSLGFTVLGIANNHSFDFESASDTRRSADAIEAVGLNAAGLSFEPVIREIGGLSFAVIATTCHVNPPGAIGPVAFLSRRTFPALSQTIQRYRRQVDYVVVLAHWGYDYEPWPRRRIRELAQELLDCGANVVYGNHPHILWPVQQPKPHQLICFSLGNFSQLIGCTSAHPDYERYRQALAGGLLTVEFAPSGITTSLRPLVSRHNYDAWSAALGTPKSYWSWDVDDVARWARTLETERPRLRSRVELAGPAQPPPATMDEVWRLRQSALRLL